MLLYGHFKSTSLFIHSNSDTLSVKHPTFSLVSLRVPDTCIRYGLESS
ncbi:hypothetical protein VCR17J2_280002 [Vibrio coralliirubri]|nr:hypothetical protein VCR17J2_280002 [Vibrio coralliirubri]